MSVTKNKVIFLAILLLIGLYAWLQHKTHVLQYWEYIFFALFIGLHLLMHAGHGHGGAHNHDEEKS